MYLYAICENIPIVYNFWLEKLIKKKKSKLTQEDHYKHFLNKGLREDVKIDELFEGLCFNLEQVNFVSFKKDMIAKMIKICGGKVLSRREIIDFPKDTDKKMKVIVDLGNKSDDRWF